MKKYVNKQIKRIITAQIIGLSLFVFLAACTENAKEAMKSKELWVLELQVVPAKLTINPDKFYKKPFTVRAKYSNATVKNITTEIKWVSENTQLLDINAKGELIARGDCKNASCPVFLVGTDPASGKSVRVTVNVKQREKKADLGQDKKKA